MNRFASTGETADPCGVPRSRCRKVPSGSCSGALQPPLHIQHHPRLVGVGLHRLDHEIVVTLSKNFWMSRSITQSVFQQRCPAYRHRVQRRPLRPVAVGVRVEDRFDLRLQTAWLPPSARPCPRPWARPASWSRRHAASVSPPPSPEAESSVPEDIRFQILYRLSFRSFSNSSIDTPSTPGAPLLAFTLPIRLPYLPLRDIKRLVLTTSARSPSSSRTAPVDRTNTATDDPAPSLHPHYRSFTTTTSRSASTPRDGTQPLTFLPLGALPLATTPSRQCRGVPSHVPCEKQQIRLTSPPCRTPPGQ